MITGWRIADPRFSQTHEQMLSGEGAFRAGGRWNSKGVRVVYLGSSLAQAAMELLVHLGRADILRQYHVTSVSFPEDALNHIDIDDLPEDWREASISPSIQAVGDLWAEEQSSLVLQVPSAAVDGEYNYLLNPNHPDFSQLTLGPINPYRFDGRLLK